MSWHAKIDGKKIFDILNNLGQFIDEAIFQLKKDGILIQASDRSMVCYFDVKIPSTEFDTYILEQETNLSFNMTNFLLFLKRGKYEKMAFTLTKDKIIELEMGVRKFSIPQVEVSKREMPNIEQLKFTAVAEIKSDIFKTSVGDCDIISDTMRIAVDKDKLVMGTADNISKTENTIFKGTDILYEMSGEGNSLYSLDYFKKISCGEKVKLEFGKDYPLRLTTIFNNSSFMMIIAPRVSEEE